MKLGEREIIYLSLHCHHQNDSCIKMGSDESHFNVSSKRLWFVDTVLFKLQALVYDILLRTTKYANV